ncbi:MAG TPA: hypothetical protein VF607_14135, partial [Verrucomicrobiae bacterium]
MHNQALKLGIAITFLLIALAFVHRSFYGMRIPQDKLSGAGPANKKPVVVTDVTRTATTGFNAESQTTLKG